MVRVRSHLVATLTLDIDFREKNELIADNIKEMYADDMLEEIREMIQGDLRDDGTVSIALVENDLEIVEENNDDKG